MDPARTETVKPRQWLIYGVLVAVVVVETVVMAVGFFYLGHDYCIPAAVDDTPPSCDALTESSILLQNRLSNGECVAP